MKLGLSHQRPEVLTDAHLGYCRQMGVDALEVRAPSEALSPQTMRTIRDRVESAGLSLHQLMMSDRYNCTAIAVAGQERDREVEVFQRFVEDLGRAGIQRTTYAWHTGGVFRTGDGVTRGCRTRQFDLSAAAAAPLLYDRTYTSDELWENYAWFVERMLPVAESAGVTMQLHPNDPPIDHAGVPRLFSNTGAFLRAMEMANHSPHWAVKFCVGCFGEMMGPNGRGEDVIGAIEALGANGHITEVHFRNVDAPMPRFNEVFPDNGYLDMPRIVDALRRIGFDGMISPDHVPKCEDGEGGPKAPEAYILGYIRALIQASDR